MFLGESHLAKADREIEEKDIGQGFDFVEGDGGEKLQLLDRWVRIISMALLD